MCTAVEAHGHFALDDRDICLHVDQIANDLLGPEHRRDHACGWPSCDRGRWRGRVLGGGDCQLFSPGSTMYLWGSASEQS